MTATITSCRLHGDIKAVETRKGVEATATYFVSVDNPTVGPHVIEQSQILLGGNNHRVQSIGETFALEVDSVGYDYAGLEVDQIVAEQRVPGPEGRTKWRIRVTYRNPSYRQLDPNRQLPPQERPLRFWTESQPITEPRAFGKNVSDIKWPWNESDAISNPPAVRKKGTLGPITNAAGFRFGSVPSKTTYLPVFCFVAYTLNPFRWIEIQDQFAGTTNSKPWNVFGAMKNGRTVSPGTSMFLRAEESRPKYFGQLEYFEVTVRVLYNSKTHQIRQRNEGDKFWRKREISDVGATGDRFQYVIERPYAGGLPAEPPVPLTDAGEEKTDATDGVDELLFQDLESKDYATLNSAVSGLR